MSNSISTKIMIIEDMEEISQLMKLYMENEGYETLICSTAEQALDEINSGYNPSLILLDLNLPGMSGYDFLNSFRNEIKNIVPVIIVSARDSDEDIIKGLGIGADEFVTKPFSPKVLVARVKSKLIRFRQTSEAAEKTITFGPYTIFCNSCVLKKGGQKIPLSTKEYEVLEYLANHENTPITPEDIYKAIWNSEFRDITAVAVYIQRLRKKIEEEPSKPLYIKTKFGLGYIFER